MIRIVKESDAQAIADIYNYYIEHTIITFEEELVSVDEMRNRLSSRNKKLPYYVFERDHQVIGYAYASEWKSRCAYKHSAESTIYLKNDVISNGIGTALYTKLIHELQSMNYHAIIGGVALPNEASVRLHEKLGYKKVAHFKEVGFKFNQWIDVGYWELIVETNHQ